MRREREQRLSRRQYVQILAGASVASVAGCTGSDGGDGSSGDGGDGSSGDDGGNGTDGGDGEGGDGGDEWNPGEPQRTGVRVHVDNFPENSNFNEFAPSPRTQGQAWVTELSAPNDLQTGEPLLDGHTWDASEFHPNPDVDEVEIPVLYADHEVEVPYDTWEYLRGHDGDEPLTYWDGTPIDAQAVVDYERLFYDADMGAFDDSSEFTFEVEDEFTVHSWRSEDNPAAQMILEQDRVYDQYTPLHPDFTTPYVESFADAGSESEAESVVNELEGDNISFTRLAEEEWGSGLYQLDPEQIGSETGVMVKRDDHPNEHATVEEVHLQFASTDRLPILANQGEIDLHDDIVQQEDGPWVRSELPDHIQELQRYLQDGSDFLLLNWGNRHLQNLWVRRAIVAAVDWYAVGANGWGAESSIPGEHHVHLPDLSAEAAFSQEFLDSLYQYPIESDTELAAEWMQRAGYTRDGDTWIDPEGEEVQFTVPIPTNISPWVPGSQTVIANLQEFGIAAEFSGMEEATWAPRLEPENSSVPLTFMWGLSGNPWDYYTSSGAWWAMPIVGGDPQAGNPQAVDPSDYSDRDNWGRPFEQQLPTEPGTIEAPDQAGRQPDLQGAGVDAEEISLPQVIQTIQDYESSEEERQEAYRKCARYSNYYLPGYCFHSYTHGLIGNVRDFNFPPEGHGANFVWKGFGGQEYIGQGGFVQNKYDDSYSDP